MKKEWLRPDEIATVLNVDKRTVYRLLASGVMRWFRLSGRGSAIRVNRSDFNKYIDERLAATEFEDGIIFCDTWDT